MISTDLISSTPVVKVFFESFISCCDTEISRGSLISPAMFKRNSFTFIHKFLPQVLIVDLYEYSRPGRGNETPQISNSPSPWKTLGLVEETDTFKIQTKIHLKYKQTSRPHPVTLNEQMLIDSI